MKDQIVGPNILDNLELLENNENIAKTQRE